MLDIEVRTYLWWARSNMKLLTAMTRTEQARVYARSKRGQFKRLEAETGLTYWWISRFAQGGIKNPAADRVDRLLAHRDGDGERAA